MQLLTAITSFALKTTTVLGLVALSVTPVIGDSVGNWITAPQICQGSAISDSAKAAHWRLDREKRVAVATTESGTISCNVLPVDGANFVISVRLRLEESAQCRLSLGEVSCDVSHSGTVAALSFHGDDMRSQELTGEDVGAWTDVALKRWDGKLSASINGRPAVDLGSHTLPVGKIALRALRGTIEVRNFVITGDLARRASLN